ncbi:MAG: patatin-like phospholipase family protein [Candidatus Baltobacteraceae bacterium]
MKALVLSGGGARGAYEAGAASVLARSQNYDIVCGTSIGAINAAFVAAGRADALREFWCDILPVRVERLLPHVARMRHMLADFGELGRGSRWKDARRIVHALSDMRFLKVLIARVGSSPDRHISALARELQGLLDLSDVRCRLLVAATNVSLGMPATFYTGEHTPGSSAPANHGERQTASEWRRIEADHFAWAILASAALPGLVAPIALEFDGLLSNYADGGLVHNSPIGLAIDAGATDITVVFVDPVFSIASACPEHSIGRMACAVFVLWQQRVLEYELRLVEATNALIRAGAGKERREIHVAYVQPERPLTVDVLGFDDVEAIAETFAQGARDAERPVLLS